MEFNNDVLNNIQVEYRNLLAELQTVIGEPSFGFSTALKLIDEVKLFWLKRLNLIEFEIERWSSSRECLLLSGAMYLDVENFEHYPFVLIGDYHVVEEPLIKFEGFFRNSNDTFKDSYTLNLFKEAYYDTFKIARDYPTSIHILPVKDLYNQNNSKLELFDTFYWKFVSSILNTDLKSGSEFLANYSSLSDIENGLDDYVLDNLVFTDIMDSKLNLEERCEKYRSQYPQLANLSNIRVFQFATYSFVTQALDILLTSVSSGFTPYIRNDITFRYFLLLKDTFVEDEKIRIMVEKTIIIFIMYNTISLEKLIKYNFNDLYEKVKEGQLLKRISERLSMSNITVLDGEVEKIGKMIHEELRNIIEIN
ncbi:hypothetical protein [Sporosarcina ureae]|uniref:hypothetical protein n=1 Tax=Sporosarcina ureae TaxID=1571 RepID=UPI0009DC5E8C|nr:hypothetical protein [Sporosarcina ureae]ARF16729.1 hypothetical protein SporoP17a_05140 [Sporosarcina ureae]